MRESGHKECKLVGLGEEKGVLLDREKRRCYNCV